MSVPTAITDLSTTAASNSPAGSESIGISLDNYLRAHSAFIAQLYGSSAIYCGTVGGTANAITLTSTLAATAYAAGPQIIFIPASNNTSGTVTANLNSIGNKTIKKSIGGSVVALAVNDLVANTFAILEYNSTDLVLLNPGGDGQGADIVSATTTDLDAATGKYVDVTGTITITGITLSQGRRRLVRFTGALTLTHGASLILPGAANITTAAGDFAEFVGYASGVVRCISYNKISAAANSIRGNNTGSLGPVIDLTAAQVRALLGGNLLNVQRFIADGTYNPTSGTTKAVMFSIGGGGGGGGSGTTTTGGTGGTGGTTSVGSILVAIGGVGGARNSSAVGGNGGAGADNSTGTGTVLLNGSGGATADGAATNGSAGGQGAPGLFGMGAGIGGTSTGGAAQANTGGGGGGATGNGTIGAAGGGGGGGLSILYTSSITGTYAVSIGAAGTAGTAGTSGAAGGAGGSGHVIILEFS